MKKLESNSEKNIGATSKTTAIAALMVLVSVTILSLHSLSAIIIPDTALQLVVAEDQQNVNSMEQINFSSSFSNFFSLGTPFLVEYDNTTSLKAKENAGPQSFDLTFEGYGTVNDIRYKDTGTGIFLTDPGDGSVYQKGVIELKTD